MSTTFYPREIEKSALALDDLVKRVHADMADRADYIADTRKLALLPRTLDGDIASPATLHIDGVDGEFGITDHAHGQIAAKLDIPKKFYDRLGVDYPGQWGQVTNAILANEPKRTMVRTLRGHARAVMSDSYRALDNYELLNAILPILGAIPDVVFPRMSLTDTRMYITALSPGISADVAEGDSVCAGVRIQNSEVGNGSLAVYPLIWRKICDNGMVREAFGQRKYHVGGRAEDSEDAYRVFSDETRQLADAAFFAKMGDVVRAAVSDTLFGQMVDQLRNASDQHIEGDVVEAVTEVTKRFDLTDGEQSGVMRHIIEGGDLSMWGMVNAITRTAQDTADFDRAMDLERIGGRVIELPAPEWRAIATATR